MKGMSVPVREILAEKDRGSGTPYRTKLPFDKAGQSPQNAHEQLAHSRYLPANGQKLSSPCPLCLCGEPWWAMAPPKATKGSGQQMGIGALMRGEKRLNFYKHVWVLNGLVTFYEEEEQTT